MCILEQETERRKRERDKQTESERERDREEGERERQTDRVRVRERVKKRIDMLMSLATYVHEVPNVAYTELGRVCTAQCCLCYFVLTREIVNKHLAPLEPKWCPFRVCLREPFLTKPRTQIASTRVYTSSMREGQNDNGRDELVWNIAQMLTREQHTCLTWQ